MFDALKFQDMIKVEVSEEDASEVEEPSGKNFSWNVTHYER